MEALLKNVLPSDAQPKRMILKRDPSTSAQKPASDTGARPEKTLAQRERDYEAAKLRIFSDAVGAPQGPAPSAAPGSTPAKQPKKSGKRK